MAKSWRSNQLGSPLHDRQSDFFFPSTDGISGDYRLLLSRRAATLWEGTPWCKGGIGKAEDAKLMEVSVKGVARRRKTCFNH